MNYAFLMPMLGFGGLEMQMIKRANDAIIAGDEAVIICMPDSYVEEYAKSLNIAVRYLIPKIKYFDLISAYNLSNIFKDLNIDICIVGHTRFLSLALIARKFYKKEMATILYQQMQSGLKKIDFFHNWIYRNLDGAVVLTNQMKKELCSTTIFPENKIADIPYGLSLEIFSPKLYIKSDLRKKFDLPSSKFIFGIVGRIETQKGQKHAIEAFIRADIKDAMLLIVGTVFMEDYKSELDRLISENNAGENIIFMPFSSEIHLLMNCLDVLVLASFSETFGLVNIEAMAAGVPVIATKSGGVPEIIQHEVNGMLFEPKDTNTLAEYMRKLFLDREFTQRLSENAINDSHSRYDYITQTKNFFEFCELSYSIRNQTAF